MGKVLGGGSSINAMAWVDGDKNDWDVFGCGGADLAWNYESVSKIYRRIEDWHGAPDPKYRGSGGPLYVQPASISNPIFPAMLEGARSVRIPIFDNLNGRMMEAEEGASISERRVRDGKRQSVFRTYTYPYMDRRNLTVLSRAMVTRLIYEGKRVSGVEIVYGDKTHRIGAGVEVILSLGAMNTPKLLMQSGIGDQAELQRCGIPLVQHLPGVGQNFQDHVRSAWIWENPEQLSPTSAGGATICWKSEPHL